MTFRSSARRRWFNLRPGDTWAPFPKRVLLTGDTAGGVWTFVTELATGLLAEGVDVLLATFGPAVTEAQRKQAQAISGLAWHHHFSKLEWMEEPWSDIREAGGWLLDLAFYFRPDVVHLNTLCHADLPWGAPVVLSAHSCVTAWWKAVKQTPLPASWDRYEREVQQSFHAATVITAPSQAALAHVKRHYRIHGQAAVAIYNGRKGDLFQLREKQKYILSVGRFWDEAKNVKALAGVAQQLEWPVYLAGSLLSPSDQTVTFANCHTLGELSISDLAAWYSGAAIYVLPAIYEPFGLSVLEAALSGCALVLGDIDTFREIWLDAAVYVPPNDSMALKKAIELLISDHDYRQQMSLRARRRAAAFTHSHMLVDYASVYETASELYMRAGGRCACAS